MRWTGSTAFPALLPGCDDLIAAGDMTARHGKESVLQLRKGALPPTGIVCVNESTALGALAGLRELGLVVGVDASVIAYDDINASGYFAPPLTTFYQPVAALWRQLGAFLLRRLAGEDIAGLTRIYRPDLVARQVDRLASAGPKVRKAAEFQPSPRFQDRGRAAISSSCRMRKVAWSGT